MGTPKMICRRRLSDGKLHEECGVFGISPGQNVSPAFETYSALYALQHRGQESCGIAVCRDGAITLHKNLGLVHQVFDDALLKKMQGEAAIGHVRYSTTGTNNPQNAQPILVNHMGGDIAVAHNGNLTNADILRREMELAGGIFQTSNDSEIIAHLMVRECLSAPSLEEAVKKALLMVEGAYSLVLLGGDKLIAARDPNGFRPLCMGKLGKSFVFASESCALDVIGAEFIRNVLPGEIAIVEKGQLHSIHLNTGAKPSLCVFEYIYFARADSVIEGRSVEMARQLMGKCLAIQHPVTADLVIGVPDSGLSAALGYSLQSGIPYGAGFVKNRYVGRTFIQPKQGDREKGVRIKLSPLAAAVNDKRVVVVDDSIVRGTTTAHTIAMLRGAGAKEVHLRISSPPFRFPCYFGTDIPDTDLLIATKYTAYEIAKIVGADSLGYLSIDFLKKVDGMNGCTDSLCMGCFTGHYAVKTPLKANKYVFEGRKRI